MNWLHRSHGLRRRSDFPLGESKEYITRAKQLDDLTTQIEDLIKRLQDEEIESNP